MHIESLLAKRSIQRRELCKLFRKPDASRRRRTAILTDRRSAVLAANGELFRSLDAHFDASSGTAQKRDQNGTVREELGQGHGLIDSIRRLDDDGLIGAAAEDEHISGLCQRA